MTTDPICQDVSTVAPLQALGSLKVRAAHLGPFEAGNPWCSPGSSGMAAILLLHKPRVRTCACVWKFKLCFENTKRALITGGYNELVPVVTVMVSGYRNAHTLTTPQNSAKCIFVFFFLVTQPFLSLKTSSTPEKHPALACICSLSLGYILHIYIYICIYKHKCKTSHLQLPSQE